MLLRRLRARRRRQAWQSGERENRAPMPMAALPGGAFRAACAHAEREIGRADAHDACRQWYHTKPSPCADRARQRRRDQPQSCQDPDCPVNCACIRVHDLPFSKLPHTEVTAATAMPV